MGRRRIRIDKTVLAGVLKAGFFGEGIVTSDAPADLTVIGVVDPQYTPADSIDLIVESAAYTPDFDVPAHKLPLEQIAFWVKLFDRYGDLYAASPDDLDGLEDLIEGGDA